MSRAKYKIRSFHGGIHPPENKTQSTRTAIARPSLPPRLILPLQQQAGQASEAIVAIGDKVLKGQMIAEPQGYISASLHAPTSGTITDIGDHAIPHPSGLPGPCIVLEPDGEERWIERKPLPQYEQLEAAQRAELLEHIRSHGIIGMGGAGFPTAVKLNPSHDITIHTLVINAAECEPYITADDMLMRERAAEVIAGIGIIAHILQPEISLIGIEDNKPEAIAALEQALVADTGNLKTTKEAAKIELRIVPTKYPSGGEKQLIQLLTGTEVPSGGIPSDIGIVCQNVGTAAAVYRAVIHGEPLISRITTLTGNALERPGNIEALIGTPIQYLLDYAGVREEKLRRLVVGGPMMGFTLDSPEAAIIKTSNCILAADQQELPLPAPQQPCIRCGLCEQVCPATLLPQQLFWFAKAKEFDRAVDHNLFDCIECGACSYVCPSNIPLVQYYRFAKGEIRLEEDEQIQSEHARQRFEARNARLQREAAEKEAKRKARAAQAAAKKAAGKTTKATDPEADDQTTNPEQQDKAAVIQAALRRSKEKKALKATAQAEQVGADQGQGQNKDEAAP